MHDKDNDKFLELARYDARAQLMRVSDESAVGEFGSGAMPKYLSSPYIFYEKCVSRLINTQYKVLELGAGVGFHTWTLVKTGGRVTATDISPGSLKLLEQRIVNAGGNVRTQVADMEALPFADESFDVVVCAGSLSYGEPALVDAEIKRVLRSGGTLLCVDSLNENPIYRFNRWLHFLRGERTKSTLQRMPNIARIESLGRGFASVSVHYFGALTFMMPVVARLCAEETSWAVSDYFDRLINAKRSAFKFVLIAKDLIK
jgi:ubiquinone/menaquinone biosynthesis C-methylase UbiE